MILQWVFTNIALPVLYFEKSSSLQHHDKINQTFFPEEFFAETELQLCTVW
jgi:hypothetical protein